MKSTFGPRLRRGLLTVAGLLVAVGAVPVAAGSAAADYNHANRVYLLGDSTLAALRWSGTAPMLKPYDYLLDAESCRRIVLPSCRGREGYQPNTGIEAMHEHDGQLGDTVVAMIGYDDAGNVFGDSVDNLVAEAKRQGVKRIIWLSFRTDVSYVGPTYASNDTTYKSNNKILKEKATQYAGYIQLADWDGIGSQHPDWFADDGVHLSLVGAAQLADFLHTTLDGVIGRCGDTSPAQGDATVASTPFTDAAASGVTLVSPKRLVDTRTGGTVGEGRALRVPLAGVVPADATSVIVNITGPDPCVPGFLAAYGCNQAAPTTSNVNLDENDTRATSAIVPIQGTDLCVLAQERSDVIVDLFGYTSPSSTNLLTPLTPLRLVDTRDGSGLVKRKGALASGEVLELGTATVAGRPASPTGIAVNVTAVGAASAGWLAVFPCGQSTDTSIVNFEKGDTVANAALVALPADGRLCVTGNSSVQVIVDVNGWIASTGPLHVAKAPTRLVDTRAGKGGARLPANGVLRVPVGVARGAVLSVTSVGAALPTFVTVYPCDAPRPVASNLNTNGTATSGEIRSNLVVTALSTSGEACIYTGQPTDVVVDVFGLLTTPAPPAPTPPPTPAA